MRAVWADEGRAGGAAILNKRQALEGRPCAVDDGHALGEFAVVIGSAPVDRAEIGGEDGRGMQLAVEDAVGKDLRLGTRQGLGKVGLRGQGCRHSGRGGSGGVYDGVERAVNHHGSQDHQADVSNSFHHTLQKVNSINPGRLNG